MITSESPAIQSRSFFCGVNFCLAGGFATTGFVGFGVGGRVRVHRGRRDDDRDVDLVCVVPAHRVLHEAAGPVEQERVTDVSEAARERERDVALRARLAVERRLVHPRGEQQRPEDETEQRHDQPVPGGRVAPPVLGPRAAAATPSPGRRIRLGLLRLLAARRASPRSARLLPRRPPPRLRSLPQPSSPARRSRVAARPVPAVQSSADASSPGGEGATCSADSRIGGSFGSSGGFEDDIRSGSR